jgi:transposase
MGVRSVSLACHHYQLKPNMLSRWKAQFLERAASVFAREDQSHPALARVAELERLVGRLTLELGVAKKASSLLQAHLSRGGK